MVFVVPVVHEAIDVQDVEEGARSNGQLDKRSETSVFGLHVFVLPPPVGPAEAPAHGDRAVVPAGKPLGQFTQLCFAERGILLSIKDCRVVGSVNLLVVLLGEISKSHETHDDVRKGLGFDKLEVSYWQFLIMNIESDATVFSSSRDICWIYR